MFSCFCVCVTNAVSFDKQICYDWHNDLCFFVTNMNWKTTKYHCHSDKHFTKNNAKYSFNRCWEILNSLRFAHHWQLLLFMLCAVLSKINNLNRELSLFQDLPHHTKYFYILLVKITLIECVSSQINSD